MDLTDEYIQEGVNPGGYYKAVWCRDASYILYDWFLSGRFGDVMQELMFIWSHQITSTSEKLVYGRGSPEMKYLSQIVNHELHKKFEGSLPTTIFHGFSEVYAKNPDIDSTALMVSTTSWILNAYMQAGLIMPSGIATSSSSFHSEQQHQLPLDNQISSVVSDPSVVINFVVPRMLKAIDYLQTRDIDEDGLLEQEHNEDWMDTVLRAGKVVYSQACWILALNNLSELLSALGNNKEAERTKTLASKTISSVEQQLWSEEEGTYIDAQETHHIGGPYRTLTQDVSLYVVAITENTKNDMLSMQFKKKEENNRDIKQEQMRRARSTLEVFKTRIWKNRWPLVTEVELKKTGPWVLNPNQYHNHTLWPWITGMEMQARSRIGEFQECDTLMSTLLEVDSLGNLLTFYEWINPITRKGDGAYPFRTGISSIRIAITDMLSNIERDRANRL
jgi:hypothetical protein